MRGYCFKCRRKVKMKNPELVTLRSGQTMTKGTCPDCGIKVLRCDGKTITKRHKQIVKETNAQKHSRAKIGYL